MYKALPDMHAAAVLELAIAQRALTVSNSAQRIDSSYSQKQSIKKTHPNLEGCLAHMPVRSVPAPQSKYTEPLQFSQLQNVQRASVGRWKAELFVQTRQRPITGVHAARAFICALVAHLVVQRD